MPPKKAKAQGPALTGCSITFAANSIPADELNGNGLTWAKDEVKSKGGLYTTKIEDSTHLVVTEAQYNKDLTKIKKAKSEFNTTVHIVSFDWLETSLTSNIRADENQYGFAVAKSATNNGSIDTNADTGSTQGSADSTASKKRKRDSSDSKTSVSKRSHGNGKQLNVTKKLDMKIPLDEVFKLRHGSQWTVYIDDDSNIFDVTLNQSDSSANANKFYLCQILHGNGQWHTWTRWGRVGEDGQMKLLGDGTFDNAMSEFKKKFKDKTGNSWEDRATGPIRAKKYVFIERSYEGDSDSEGEDELPGADKRKKVKEEVDDDNTTVVQSKLEPAVQDLMKLIFNKDYFNNTMADFNYDADKMPLGKLSKASLLRGYEVLKTLAGVVNDTTTTRGEIETLSNQYLSLIPHVVTRSQRPPVLDNFEKVKKELELLEALTDMQLANDLMKNAAKNKKDAEEIALLDRQFAGLGLEEMAPLSRKSSEFMDLEAYLTKSVGHTHGTRYQVQEIFRIERSGEHERFEKSSYSNIPNKNRRLLWHGSRSSNMGGILSQGLRIAPPEAPATGYMFGKGVYLADMSSKSANYCASYSSGGNALLLLCEAELGDPPLKLISADYNAGDRAKSENKLSTWGVGNTVPQAWKDAGTIHKSLSGISMPDVVSKQPGASNEVGAYLQYNEYIVYDVAQIKLRYLFRVSM